MLLWGCCFSVFCFAVGQLAERGNAAAGTRRGIGGPKALGWAGSAATPPSGAETPRSNSLTETETARGNGTESGRRRRTKGRMTKRRKSCWNLPGSAAPMLRTTTPMTTWTKWYLSRFFSSSYQCEVQSAVVYDDHRWNSFYLHIAVKTYCVYTTQAFLLD